MPHKQTRIERETSNRVERLGFRLDEETKDLIERAAYLSRRKISDFCVTALTDTARRTIAEHETLVLSDRDRKAFFDALALRPSPASGWCALWLSISAGSLPEHGAASAGFENRGARATSRSGRFSSGADSLDRYLRTQASQDVRRKANGVFILVEPEKPDVVLGYYTLCATALPQGDVPTVARKHVPRYPLVSATLIGREPR